MTQMTAVMDGDWIPTPVEYEAITGTGFQTSWKRGKLSLTLVTRKGCLYLPVKFASMSGWLEFTDGKHFSSQARVRTPPHD